MNNELFEYSPIPQRPALTWPGGARVGFWRLAEIFDRHGSRASVLLNSEVVERYPQIIEAGVQRDWAWLAHGKTNSALHTGYEQDQERAILTDIFTTHGWTGPDFVQALKDQFDVLYAESATSGRVMSLALHPFVIGQAFRAKYLDEALSYIAGHDGVWLTTSDDIATHYRSGMEKQ